MKNIICLITIFAMTAISEAQSLEILIQEAMDNHPLLQKLEYQNKIAQERVNEVNTLPNTEFTVGAMAIGPEMDMPMERFSISAMQMIPWFGTLDAKANYIASLANTQEVDITIARKKIALSVMQLYYQLYELEAKHNVWLENKKLLETYEQLALTSLQVGRASAVDVLKLQMRQNEIEEKISILLEQKESLMVAMLRTLNRKEKTPIIINLNLRIPEEGTIYADEQLLNHPELLKYETIAETIRQSEKMNLKESKPVIGIGIKYVNQTHSPMVTSSFKDMIMPMVSLSIPFFNKKYKSISLQNEMKEMEIFAQKEEHFNELSAQLSKVQSQLKQARIKHNTQMKNLILVKNAEKILLKNYETNTVNYDEVIEIQELKLKLEESKIESIRSFYEQIAWLNYLILSQE